ncbi:integrase, catalytic region, zinc finger, CCHC-type containing protein [Tanacetum coccineum]
MKEIFEELKAEVDQNVVNMKFTEMHDAHTVVQARYLELEVELSKLNDKVQKDDHTELVKRFSNLKVNHLNLQLKFQHLKESFGNNTSLPARDAPDFDSVFVIEKIKASIQGKDNTIKKLRMQISQLKETRSEADRTLDFRALDFQITQLTEKVIVLQEQNEIFRAENTKIKQHYKELYAIDVEPIPPRNRNNREVHLDYLKHLKESVETLREIVDEAKVERTLDRSLAFACLYTKHSQELLEYVIGTCSKDFNKRDKKHVSTPLTRKKQVTFADQCEMSNNNTNKHVEQLNIQKTNVPVIPSTRVNSCTDTSGSKPKSNTKKNRISPAKSVNKNKVVQISLWYLDSGCSKHMTGDCSRLRNFMKKFIGTVRFRNDHFGAIMGYGYYVIGDSVISRVYYVEGLGHNLFFVRQFCDSDLEVAFRKHSCYVRDTDGVDLLKGSRGSNLYTISVEDMMKSSIICLLSKASKNKSWLWHRHLNHLNFCTINDLSRKDLIQFCDSDFEVAFRKHSCYVRDTDGVDLLKGSRGSNLYTISVEDMMKSSLICLLSKASKNKSWLWHRHLNHLNFCTINDLARKDLVRGLPILKFEKDHLCSACQLGKSKKHTHTPKTENTNLEVLNTLHMDLYGPIRVQTINMKKYILVIVDDYYRSCCYCLLHPKSIPYLHSSSQNPIRTLLDKKLDLTFLRVFGALCYPTNDSEDLGKLQPTDDIGIFIGYALSRKGYRIYNKRTRRIMETIHVQFDKLYELMAPVQLDTGTAPRFLTLG